MTFNITHDRGHFLMRNERNKMNTTWVTTAESILPLQNLSVFPNAPFSFESKFKTPYATLIILRNKDKPLGQNKITIQVFQSNDQPSMHAYTEHQDQILPPPSVLAFQLTTQTQRNTTPHLGSTRMPTNKKPQTKNQEKGEKEEKKKRIQKSSYTKKTQVRNNVARQESLHSDDLVDRLVMDIAQGGQ